MIRGYARVSTKTQNIERQIRNILLAYPDAKIYQEIYTGTQIVGRREFNKLLKDSRPGDTIVFDSVSRMSRNAEEGIEQYFTLYEKGIHLVFLKEQHINTDSYQKALEHTIGLSYETETGSAEGKLIQGIMDAINEFMKAKASDDIIKAFEQSEKEVLDLRQRTREGILTAKNNGKQPGRRTGQKIETKKSYIMKEKIQKIAKDFNGNMSDKEVIETLGIARNTYYKYKRELFESMASLN